MKINYNISIDGYVLGNGHPEYEITEDVWNKYKKPLNTKWAEYFIPCSIETIELIEKNGEPYSKDYSK